MLNRLDDGEAAARGGRSCLVSREAGRVVPAYVASDEPAKSERALRGKHVPIIFKVAKITKAT